MSNINLGIVGVSGVVGSKFVEVLEEYGMLFNKVKFFASKKSVGKKVRFHDKEIIIEELQKGCFKGLDYVLFSAGSDVASIWGLEAEKEGAIVIDNSSAFRNDLDIPLIVSEININDFYSSKRRIIANPNCSTIQSVVVLNEINKVNEIEEIIYSTYQAVSGAGKKGIDDLVNNTTNKFPIIIKDTCIPIIGDLLDNKYTNEEMKMINETKKILHNDKLKISATCVRVPVLNSHAVNMYIVCKNEIDIEKIKERLSLCPSLVILDDNNLNLFPNSIIANGNDYIFVGRIRIDLNNPKAMWVYCVSDNLRKGAASNAVQIMKYLIEKDQ